MKFNIVSLKGYSGLKVSLYKDKVFGYIVRKEAKNISQNTRLKKQYQKHLYFFNLKSDLFKVPLIISKGYQNRLFFYEYQFSEGITLLDYIQKKSNKEIAFILDKIIDIIKYLKSHGNTFEKIDTDVSIVSSFEKKIKKNFKKTQVPKIIKDSMMKKLNQIPKNMKQTLSHGDLSFDNIIIDKKRGIILIDFMDLFYSHYWLDISKMFQDIDGGWSEIKHGIILPDKKVKNIRRYLIEGISKIDKEYFKYHNFLMAVVFLRILPYAKDELDRKRIINKMRVFVNC